MSKAKPAEILRALSPRRRPYAARRPGALGALLLAALLSVGLAAWLLGPSDPAQAQPAASSDATLSGLALLDWHSRELPLRPAFSAQTAEYGGTLPLLSTPLVQLRPTANHSGATITVDGKAVASGAKSEHFRLEINTPKRIVVAVTAEDGVTRREYAVTATQDPRAELRGLSIAPGRLHPFVFSGSHTEYRAWVGHGDAEVKVTPTNRYDKGTITVNGHTVASGQASPGIALAEGENVIAVTITGPDNYTSRTYTLTITRATAAASADATLAGLAVYTATSSQPDAGNEVPYEGTAYPLTPALASGVYEYRVVVPEAVARRARESEESGYVYVTAVSTTTAPGAKSIVVEGRKSHEEARHPKREVVTGESSGPWYAFIGYSPITVAVTSLDGKNTQTYRVVVEHGQVDDLQGVALTPGDGQLTLSWGAATGSHPPNLYWARWREAGTTTWLNGATLAAWKTGYGDGAPKATAADGYRVTGNSHVITGLTNGTEYEVELRGTRGGDTSYQVTNWLKSPWVTVKDTPGQTAAARTLTITPSAPSREYGGTDDLSYAVSGLDAGDAATDVVTGTLARAAGNGAGSYAFDLSGLSIATAYAQKYALPASPAVASYTITPRPIKAVSGVRVNSRPADGSAAATFDTGNAQGAGVLAAELSDFRSGGLVVSGSFPAATPGTHDVSVTYSLGDRGTFRAANYTLTSTAGTLRGEITQANCGCGSGLTLYADGVPAEGGDPVTVVVGLDRPAGPGGITVTLTAGGTATVRDDYTLSPTTVSVAAGATAGMATVAVIDDSVDDDGETIILSAAASSLSSLPLTLTITDNDDAPTLTITPGAPSREYGGTDDLSYAVGGLDPGDAATDVVTGSLSRAAGEDAGRYAFDMSGLSVAAAYADKYALPAAPTVADYTITPRAITAVSGVAVDTRPADGTTAATFDTSAAAGTGVLAAELAGFRSGGLVVSGSFPATTPGAHSLRVTYSLSDSGTFKAGNYDLSATSGTLPGELTAGIALEMPTDTGKELLMPPCEPDPARKPAPRPGVIAFIMCEDHLTVESVSTDSDITFYPEFSPDRHHYVVHVADDVTELKVTGDFKAGFPAFEDAVRDRIYVVPGFAWALVDGPAVVNRGTWLGIAVSNNINDRQTNSHHRWVNLKPGVTTIQIGASHWFKRMGRSSSESSVGPWFKASAKLARKTYTLQLVWRSPATPLEAPAEPPALRIVDYDTDDDGLIEISSLAQLDAMRWDVDGDGYSDHGGPLHEGFPNPLERMGCPQSGCVGYELTADLDFDTNGSSSADAGDAYWNSGHGWLPIGIDTRDYSAVFEGNGHIIRNLYIDSTLENQSAATEYHTNHQNSATRISPASVGLFEGLAAGGVIRNIGLESVNVSRKAACVPQSALESCWAAMYVGGLAGHSRGEISGSHVSGVVSRASTSGAGGNSRRADAVVGGLLGYAYPSSVISGSYSTASVSGKVSSSANVGSRVGGLVGHNQGAVTSSYATGDVSTNGAHRTIHNVGGLIGRNGGSVSASYATGSVTGGAAAEVGGLVGRHDGGAVTAAYWDTQASGTSSSAAGVGKTTAELQSPAGYTGIYANWNVDLDGDGNADDPWDFGNSCQYPVLKYGGLNPDDQRAPCTPIQANRAPTVSSAIADVTLKMFGRIREISLSGVFSDADNDNLTITATSSDKNVSGVSVDTINYCCLSVVSRGRGTATITVMADDGRGGTVSDTFTVTVKAAPVVASALADVSGLEVGATHDVSLTGTFSDADGDALTVTAASSDETKATVSVAADYSTLTLTGVAEGTATITVSAQDSDGNGVSDTFDAPVARKYNALIARMKEWRNDPQWVSEKAHTDRWDRALLAFGETVADGSLTPMTAAEAQAFADRGSEWSRWVEVAAALREIESAGQQQQGTPNQAPTLSAAIADVTIVNASGTRQVSLAGVFSDADSDALTVTAASSDGAVATVSVAADYSSLTVSAQARGTATITATADDGNGGAVEDAFTVKVKAAPVVASALADVSGLEARASQEVSLSGVFSDADGDALTVRAASSDETKATVSVAADYSALTLTGVAEGTATVTVTAQDSDGNRVSDAFQVEVSAAGEHAALIAQMYQWRNDPEWVSEKAHTDRWDRALLAFGETVADTSLTPMTADEAQGFADRGWERWVEVAAALREIEGAGQQEQANQAPTVSAAIADVTIVNESGTRQVALSGVFSDADNDPLTITAASSDEAVATVSVTSGGSSLTVSAQARGTATVTVTANDGNGGTVEDAFTVTVKAAPVVASAISDLTGLEEAATQEVSLSGVFGDADGDALTITAASSDETKATVSVASDGSKLTLTGVAQGTATITVTARDSDGNRVNDAFDVSVVAPQQQQQEQPNQAPTVSSAIADATIVHESGTQQVSLSGVFDDADGDNLTVSAASSDGAVATVSVAADYSSLTVNAQGRGMATVTVTADDGRGGTVEDAFTVTVKAAPVVASAIADVSGMEVGDTQEVSLSGVFSDADGDALTLTAASGDEAIATVSVAADGSRLTLTGVAEGSATVTVTARDSDGNRVSDAFDVAVEPKPEQDPPPDGETANRPPTVAQPLPDISLEELQWRQFSLADVFRDPDGDELTFTVVSSDYGVASMWVSGSTLTVVATSTGTATITVTAEDPEGNRVSDAFEVTVRPAS